MVELWGPQLKLVGHPRFGQSDGGVIVTFLGYPKSHNLWPFRNLVVGGNCDLLGILFLNYSKNLT